MIIVSAEKELFSGEHGSINGGSLRHRRLLKRDLLLIKKEIKERELFLDSDSPHRTKPAKPIRYDTCKAPGCTNQFPHSDGKVCCDIHSHGKGIPQPYRKNNVVWTQEKLDRIEKMMEQGMKRRDIAKAEGVSATNMSNQMAKLRRAKGIPARKCGFKKQVGRPLKIRGKEARA